MVEKERKKSGMVKVVKEEKDQVSDANFIDGLQSR